MGVCLCVIGLLVFLGGKMCKEFKGLGKVKKEIVGFLVEKRGEVLD